MTNIGPWELQQFYDADDTLDLVLTPALMAYNTAAEEPSWDWPPSETPNEPMFDARFTNEPEEEPYFLDPSDNMSDKARRSKAFHLSLNYDQFVHDAQVNHFLNDLEDEELLGHFEPFDTMAFAI